MLLKPEEVQAILEANPNPTPQPQPSVEGVTENRCVWDAGGMKGDLTLSVLQASGSGANAMIVVGRNAYLARENSRIEIPGNNYFLDSLRLLTGKLLAVFANGEPRRIVTPSATIGIRGTDFIVDAGETL